MRTRKLLIIIAQLLILALIGSGCWNYSEINDKAIVAGMAIDPGKDKKYLLTVEIVNPTSEGTEAKMNSVVIGMEGDSIFDAIRNMIAKVGKRLYWSHTRVMIISQEIAKEGVTPVLDLVYRDPEVRLDTLLLISQEKTAREIFEGDGEINQIRSFQFGNIMEANQSLSKVFPTELWHYLTFLFFEGSDPVVPGIRFTKKDTPDNQPSSGQGGGQSGGQGGEEKKKKEVEIFDSAIFQGDRLVGWVEADQNKYLLWAWNVYKQGVVVVKNVQDSSTDVTIEIVQSSVRVNPVKTDTGLKIDIDMTLKGSIAEINGTYNVIEESNQIKFEEEAEQFLETEMTNFIKFMQKEYSHSDVFDFGLTVKRQMPDYFKEICKDWDEIYANLPIVVHTEIQLTGSGVVIKPIDKR